MKVIFKIIGMIMVKTHSKELLCAHLRVLFFLGGAFFTFNNVNTIHEWFRHKLNYFLFCQNFEKNIYYLCQKNYNYYKIKSEMFWLSGLNFRLAISRTGECYSLDTHRLFHKDNKILFIVLNEYYLPKTSEIKNQLSKLRFEI